MKRPLTMLRWLHWPEDGQLFRHGINFCEWLPGDGFRLRWVLLWRWGLWDYYLDLLHHPKWPGNMKRLWKDGVRQSYP